MKNFGMRYVGLADGSHDLLSDVMYRERAEAR